MITKIISKLYNYKNIHLACRHISETLFILVKIRPQRTCYPSLRLKYVSFKSNYLLTRKRVARVNIKQNKTKTKSNVYASCQNEMLENNIKSWHFKIEPSSREGNKTPNRLSYPMLRGVYWKGCFESTCCKLPHHLKQWRVNTM